MRASSRSESHASPRDGQGPQSVWSEAYTGARPAILLFGVKGHMRTLSPARSQVNMIETRKREHSRKPDEQYALIESCSPGPYLEMFARYPQKNWYCWGAEADENIVPQGKQYKGYAGGEIELPRLKPNERIPDSVAGEVATALRVQYEQGKSIKLLAAENDYSIQRVRSLLERAGTELRPRGAKQRHPKE